jgi:hypothetical protein
VTVCVSVLEHGGSRKITHIAGCMSMNETKW